MSRNFQLVRSLGATFLEIGSVPAERVGQGKVGECTQRVPTAWLLLGLAIERPWSALVGPFLSSFAQMGLENGLWQLYFGLV